MPKNKTIYFQKTSFDQEEYKDCLVAAPGDINAKCKLSKKVFTLSNIVADALIFHVHHERNRQGMKNLPAIR